MQTFLQFALGFLEPASGQRPEPRRKAGRPPRAPPPSRGETQQTAQPLADLWGEPLTPVVASKPATSPAWPDAVQDGPAAPADACINGTVFPLQTVQQSLLPVAFRHPQATRQLLFGDTLVAYAFARGKRRTIGFSVGPDGLAVRAPKWVALHEVEKALLDKSGWILKKLAEARQLKERLETTRMTWADGASLPLMGQTVTLVLDPRHDFREAGAQLFSGGSGALKSVSIVDAVSEPRGGELLLHIGLPHTASGEQIRDAVQTWLMRQARAVFAGRLEHFAPTLGVQWRKLSLSSAGTRWGSANADGSIRLNWRLIHFRLPVIDYVVVHELSHLRVMNHSPQFWDTVRAVVPNYAVLRGELKSQGMPRWE